MVLIEIWCLLLILIFVFFLGVLLQKLESEVLEFELLLEWAG